MLITAVRQPRAGSALWRRLGAALVGAWCVLGAQDAAAQLTAQFPVQFNFLTPGARSLAMGGAFLGAADDATAAFTNPAGLAFFGKKQLSIEGRFDAVETPFLAGGRISGAPTGIGLDTNPDKVYESDVDRSFRPAFIAFVFPIGGSASLTGYRHVLAGVDNTFYSRGVFQRASFFGTVDDGNRDIPLGGTRAITIVNYGAAAGRSWLMGHLAVGGGLSVSTFHVDSQFARHGFVGSIFGPDDPIIVSATAVQSGDDVALSGHLGALWHTANDRVSIGGTYRRGPRFEFEQRDRVFATDLDVTRQGKFKVPDVWGGGVAWQAKDALRILVDVNRVMYSQLKSDFIDFQAISSGRESQLRIDDGTEIHGGVEYRRAVSGHTAYFRGGGWFDPDHTVRYEPNSPPDDIDTLLAAALPGGDDLMHYTFGVGWLLPKNAVLDGGADFSSRTSAITLSVLFRF